MISIVEPDETRAARDFLPISNRNAVSLDTAGVVETDNRQTACSSFTEVSRAEAKGVETAGHTGRESASDWLVWQIADSAFPTGGFAHSGGLETAWQQGEIRSSGELTEFIRVHLAQTGRAALPFLNEAYHDTQPFPKLDRLADVFLSNHVANRGSRAQGQAFLFAAAHAFPVSSLIGFRTKLLNEKLPGHFAPVFGFVIRTLGISHACGVRLFLFLALRSLLASAVRLGVAGPMAVQEMQPRLAQYAEQVGLRSAALGVAEAAQISPVLEVLHGAHDRLYSRLFQT